MLIEWRTWPYKLFKWRQDLVFEQRFNTAADGDQSETFIRKSMQSMIEQLVNEGDDAIQDEKKVSDALPIDKEMSMSVKQKKVMPLAASIYTATFVGLIRSNKKKYRLTQADQFDLLYKTMLVMAIQVFFLFGLLYFTKMQFKLNNNTGLQLCLIFTTLLLHLGNLGHFRTGLYMMKYTLCHPEEFTHPKTAFVLGLFYMFFLLVSEIINVAKGTQRKSPQDLITSYIGFKIITDLPTLFLKSI